MSKMASGDGGKNRSVDTYINSANSVRRGGKKGGGVHSKMYLGREKAGKKTQESKIRLVGAGGKGIEALSSP